jgi:bifunctional NMN adenylyltransferase/nudix hydrolase
MMDKSYTIGSLVGRFQVHELHEAHHYLIDQVVKNHKKVILFLGVSKVVGTKKNPLDFESRKNISRRLKKINIYEYKHYYCYLFINR